MSEIRFWRAVFSLLALGAALGMLFVVWQILIPFVFGLILSYLIHPLVDRFVAVGFRRDRVVVVLYVVLLAAGAMVCFYFLPILYREGQVALNTIPNYTMALDQALDKLNSGMHQILSKMIGERAEAVYIPFRAGTFLDNLFARIPNNLLNVAHVGLWFVIVPFVCFFGLSQGRQWIDLLFNWTPAEHVESLLGLLAEVSATLGGYIRGQVLEAVCVGIATLVGLALIGVEGAVLLSFITALLNFVPFLALIGGGLLAFLTATIQGQSPAVLLGVISVYLLVRVLDDILFIPFVVGHSVRLHPVVILFAVLAGYELAGFLGLVFAIPVTAIIKVLLSVLLRNRKERMLFKYHHVVA